MPITCEETTLVALKDGRVFFTPCGGAEQPLDVFACDINDMVTLSDAPGSLSGGRMRRIEGLGDADGSMTVYYHTNANPYGAVIGLKAGARGILRAPIAVDSTEQWKGLIQIESSKDMGWSPEGAKVVEYAFKGTGAMLRPGEPDT